MHSGTAFRGIGAYCIALSSSCEADDDPNECVRCLTDGHCDDGRRCSQGLCFAEDSLAYTMSLEHVEGCADACTDPDPMDCSNEVPICTSMHGRLNLFVPAEHHALTECEARHLAARM